MPEISSDLISFASYDIVLSRLTITLPDSTEYDYDGVPRQIYLEFIESDDPDGYFEEKIKDEYITL